MTYLGTDQRVLMLLPQTRDAKSIPLVLEQVGVESTLCASADEVYAEIGKGAGALLVAEEFLSRPVVSSLQKLLESQPAWSELPIIVLLRQGQQSKSVWNSLLLASDVTLVERPVRVNIFVAHVHSALRSRRRQYVVRDQMLALERSESKFAKIFNSAPALIGITTLDAGEVIDVNESALRFLGYRREEVIGRTTHELALWSEASDRATVVRAIKEDGAIRNMECKFRGKTGESYTGLLSAEIIEIDNASYLLTMVQDITGSKLADQEIERLNETLAAQVRELGAANQELEAFNRMVSHDLRQPLNAMALTAQALEMLCGAKLDEECRRYVRSMHSRILAMNGLVDTLLTFSSSTRSEVRREIVDLSALARSVAEEVHSSSPARAVTFNIAEGVVANGDANLLRVVLANLIGNAWKYTGQTEDAVIEFGVTRMEGEEVCFVKDNGKGFAMADAAGLFTPFTRLPGADSFGGFGIGLATADRIIRKLGGRIWAVAEPDKGATFYFTLPPTSPHI